MFINLESNEVYYGHHRHVFEAEKMGKGLEKYVMRLLATVLLPLC